MPRVLPAVAHLRSRARSVARRWAPPRVTVIMPVYNVAPFVRESMESVLTQSYRAIQLVVVDDGSSDGTDEIVAEIARRDRRVLMLQQSRQGPNAARNLALGHARGTYLTFLDGDDVVLPDAYRDMVGTLEQTGSDLVVGGYDRIRAGVHGPAADWIQRAHAKERRRTSAAAYPRIMVNAVQWSKMYRREFFDRDVGEFGVPGYYQDQLVSARAWVRAETVDVLARSVVGWRVRDDGSSMTQQLHQLDNLRDRLRTGREAVEILRTGGSDALADERLLQFLRYDMGTTTGRIPTTDAEYWAVLRDGLRGLVDDARSSGVWARVPSHHRVLFQLVHDDRRDDALAFIERGGRHPRDFAILEIDGATYRALPFWDEPAAGLDRELFRTGDRVT